MNEQRATHLVHAPLEVVRQVLLDPVALADWNPAFLSVGGPAEASTGVDYPITTRGGLRGFFAYLRIKSDRIDTTWRVPGLTETGTWLLEQRGGDTLVVHAFRQDGPLARLLSRAFDGVAQLRLLRLQERVQAARIPDQLTPSPPSAHRPSGTVRTFVETA